MAAPLALAAVGAAAGMIGNGLAANQEVNETINQNAQDMTELSAQKDASKKSAASKMGNLASNNLYDASVAQLEASQVAGSGKAASGFSGVRGGSPLLAMRNKELAAQNQADEIVARGESELKQVGLESSLLTEEYDRKVAQLQADTDYMKKNRWGYIGASVLGGASALGSLSPYRPTKK